MKTYISSYKLYAFPVEDLCTYKIGLPIYYTPYLQLVFENFIKYKLMKYFKWLKFFMIKNKVNN